MTDERDLRRTAASTGALGGAANEQGSQLRASVGALCAAGLLNGTQLSALGMRGVDQVPKTIVAEGDGPVDDLQIGCISGARVLIQVKLSAGLGLAAGAPIDEAVRQFMAAVAAGLGDDDRLVLAVAQPTRSLQQLEAVLARHGYFEHGPPSTAEVDALNRLGTLAARHGDKHAASRLMDHLVIWHVDTSSTALLNAQLDGRICQPGYGPEGADALRDIVRELARARGGLDDVGLVGGLQSRGVALVAAYDPASALARTQALTAHRARERERGETLALFGFTGELGRLPLVDADCEVRVAEAGEEDHIGMDLSRVVRRRGGVLLHGAPGGGKSTALRATAAHAARRADWPTPVSIDLRRLARREESLSDAVVALACEDAALPQRAALAAALHERFADGRLLLLLDAFDEVRERRLEAVSRLGTWFAELDEGVEIVLATRPVAAEDAASLGLNPATLLPPQNPEETIEAILAARAPEGNAKAWITARTRWAASARQRDPALDATPLTVVILTSVAADAIAPEALPTTRAALLREALAKAPERWETERRAGGLAIGQFSPGEARAAIEMGLAVLSETALDADGITATDAAWRLAAVVGQDFGLAPGSARGAADEILTFWLTAGVFEVKDDLLVTRVRPLAEVSLAASWVARGAGNYEQTVALARSDRDMWATLTLAAGLSPELASCWAQGIAGDGDADEFIVFVDAVTEGAMIRATEMLALADRVETLVGDHANAERASEAALVLYSDPEIRERLGPVIVSSLSGDRRLMIQALQICLWDIEGADADETLRAFISKPWPVRTGLRHEEENGVPVIRLDSIDNAYSNAYERATERLLKRSPVDAELVVDHYHAGSLRHRSRIRMLIRRSGRPELVERVDDDWPPVTRSLGEPDDFVTVSRLLLQSLFDLAEPAELSQRQCRRLDELADVFASAQANWLYPDFVLKRPTIYENWMAAIAQLAGFELGVVSAQARLLERQIEAGEEDELFVFGTGQSRRAAVWDPARPVEPVLTQLTDAIGLLPRPTDNQMFWAVSSCPERQRALSLLEARLPRLRNAARDLAGELIVATLSAIDNSRAMALVARWADGDDVPLRRVAVACHAMAIADTPGSAETWHQSLADPDEGVREKAIKGLDPQKVDDFVRESLMKLRDAERRPWECDRCGTDNAPQTACSNCRASAPQVIEAIRKLLEPPRTTAASGAALRAVRGPRRRVRFADELED